jgi:FHS family Na+ dependent glucose MFS transporter 1
MSQPLATVEKRSNLRNLIGYYAAFVGIGMVSASLGPTLSGLADQTRTTLSAISILLAARPAGYLLGSLLSGRLYDRLSGHPIMAAAILLSALGMMVTPLSLALWLLIAVMVVLGLMEGAIDVGGNTLIVWTYGAAVGPFMNGLHFMFGLGAFLAPIIIAQAMRLGGDLPGAYWALAALIAPAAFWLWRVPSPAAHTPARSEQSGRTDFSLVALLAVFFFLYVGSEGSFGAWVFTYAKTLGLADATMAAYLTSAFWGALTVGRLLSIPLAARMRPRQILTLNLIGGLISLGLVLLWPGSAVMVWVCAVGAGFSMASTFPTLLTFAERRLTITGQITSFFFVGASLGGITLPWLIGQLFERIGPWVTMATILVAVLAQGVVFVALMMYAPQPKKS